LRQFFLDKLTTKLNYFYSKAGEILLLE